MLRNILKSGIDFAARKPLLLAASLFPFLIILLLRYAFPPLSDMIFLKTGFQLASYYSIVAITLVSMIPVINGLIYAYMYFNKSDLQKFKIVSVPPAHNKTVLYTRRIVPVFLCFIMLLITVFLTDPVPAEGWLRSVFVSLLMSVQAPFVFLLIVGLTGNRRKGFVLSVLCGIFLLAVPVGLMLHHPWNYFAFFSPFYWIGWAWISNSPAESLFYGAIASVITVGCIIWFYRRLLKRSRS